jgi:flagellar assembly protein FliH
MGLIKAQHAPSSLQPFSMKDVEEAARGILLRARRQAEQLLAAAQQEAETLREQARAEGTREGFDHGFAEGSRQGAEAGRAAALEEQRRQLTDVVQGLTRAAAELNARRDELETVALGEVIGLAAAIARRVTKRQGMLDEAVLAANLSEAMRLVVAAADVSIAFHPDQRKTLEDALPRLRLDWPSLRHVELAEDPVISRGGCRIATRGGSVDADLDEQLDRVIDELMPVEKTPKPRPFPLSKGTKGTRSAKGAGKKRAAKTPPEHTAAEEA